MEEDLGAARAAVILRRHGKPIRPGVEHGNDVASGNFRELPVRGKDITALADRPGYGILCRKGSIGLVCHDHDGCVMWRGEFDA